MSISQPHFPQATPPQGDCLNDFGCRTCGIAGSSRITLLQCAPAALALLPVFTASAGKIISSIMSGLLGALPSFIWGFDFRRNEVQRAATREAVASGASLTVAYLAMNAAAALIASFGLLQNSPAVIIGAMLIAML